jgi:DNA-binding transcriptional LysR family regulator
MMETGNLRAFLAVADESSFTLAAARCFVSQPALSRRIRKLEREVGSDLFTRHAHSVSLTLAGEMLLDRARHLVQAADLTLESIRTETAEHASPPAGSLRVGLFHPAAAELTGPIIRNFRAASPASALHLIDITCGGVENAIATGRVDVALLWGPVDTDAIEARPLFTDTRAAIVANHHPLAQSASVDLAELLDQPIAEVRRVRRAWWEYWIFAAERGDHWPPMLQVDTYLDYLVATSAGLVIAWSPQSLARYSPVAGVRYIPMPAASQTTAVVAFRRTETNPAVRVFVRVAERTAKALSDLIPDTPRPDRNSGVAKAEFSTRTRPEHAKKESKRGGT